MKDIKLPTGYYFGISATTGDLSDNHDILSIRLFELDLPDDVSIVPEYLTIYIIHILHSTKCCYNIAIQYLHVKFAMFHTTLYKVRNIAATFCAAGDLINTIFSNTFNFSPEIKRTDLTSYRRLHFTNHHEVK